MDLRKILGGVFTLGVLAAVFWYRMSSDDASDRQAEEAHAVVATIVLGCDKSHKHDAFLAELEADAHETAYNAAYKPGGRRRSSSFDETVYCQRYFGYFQTRAKAKNLADLDLALRQAQIDAERALAAG